MTFSTNQTRRHFWGVIMCFSLLNYALMASASELTTDLESNNPTKAKAAFNVAIEQANSRFKHFQDNQQAIALIQTSEDEEGNLFSQEFTPETSTQGLWQTLKEDEAFNQNIEVENSIFFTTEVLDVKNSTLINETDSTWVFQVPNVLNVDTDEALSDQDKTKMDSAIAQHLSTEVIVNKNPIRITGLKVYAKQPFKPSLMASIETFELRVYFDEAWQGGPLIRHNFTQHIKGSYGWLYKIEDLITTNVSNIRQVNLSESGTE